MRSGAPVELSPRESHVRQALVVERDAELERRDEFARAGTGEGERRPLRGRIVNDDAPRIEAVLPPEFKPRDHRIRVSRRAGDEKAIVREAQGHAVVEYNAALRQEKAITDFSGFKVGEAVVAIEVGELRGVGADDLDLAQRGAVEQRDRLAGAGRLALDRRARDRPGRTMRASASRRTRASARRRRDAPAPSGSRFSGLMRAPRRRPPMTPIGTGTKGGR